jgi:outer membrane protein TolC
MHFQVKLLIYTSLLLLYNFGYSQKSISLDSAIQIALTNHPQIKVSNLQVEQQQLLKGSSIQLYNTELLFEAPQGDKMRPGILQAIEFPSVYVQQYKTHQATIDLMKADRSINTNLIKYNVQTTYVNYQYWKERYQLLKNQDSILRGLLKINEVRYNVGQISILEKISGEAKYKAIELQLLQASAEFRNSRKQFLLAIGTPEDTAYVPDRSLEKFPPVIINSSTTERITNNPIYHYYQRQQDMSKRLLKLERARRMPGLLVGYLNQGDDDSDFKYRLRFGVTLPIFYWAYHSRIKAANKGIEISENQLILEKYKLNGEYVQAVSRYRQFTQELNYYESAGLLEAAQTLKSASESYRLGSITYYVYLLNIEQAFSIELSHLEALKNYNQSIIHLNYLLGDI